MAQHDMNIADASGASVRADLNLALRALAENNSGADAPPTTFANQWWTDTSNNLLKIRNEANSAWITVGELDGGNFKPYTSDDKIEDATATAKGIVELATVAEGEAGSDTTRAMTAAAVKAAIEQFAPTAGAAPSNASTTARGIIELATQAEANALTDNSRAVPPGRLPTAGTAQKGLVELATPAEGEAGSDAERAMTPAATKAAIARQVSTVSPTNHLVIGSYAVLINAGTSDIDAGDTKQGSLYYGGTFEGVSALNTNFPTSGLTAAAGTWRAMGNKISGRTGPAGISGYAWHGGLMVRTS